MAIDKKININENQVIFKRDTGHRHDGLTSNLIDYTRYSLFDFLPTVRAPGGTRLNFQVANERLLKTFIVDAVEERVLNPQGIRIQANAITANEIAVGTITANELVRDFIMVNNTMKSNNYSAGSSGWKISNTGEAEFNNVIVRGNVQANVGTIGGWTIDSTGLSKVVPDPYGGVTSTIYPGQILLSVRNDEVVTDSSLSAARLLIDDEVYYSYVRSNGIEITENANSTTSYFKHFGAVLQGSMIINGTMTADTVTSIGAINGDNLSIVAGSIAQPIDISRSYEAGANFIRFVNSTSGNAVGAVEFNNTTTILYTTSSDIRLKENIKILQGASEILKKLEPVEYNFINDGPLVKKHGFIAQDLYEHYPYPVSVGSDDINDKPWGIDYSKVTPLLTAGFKELLNKIEELESRLQTLEGV